MLASGTRAYNSFTVKYFDQSGVGISVNLENTTSVFPPGTNILVSWSQGVNVREKNPE